MELSSRILYCDASCVVVNKIVGEAVEGIQPGMIDLPRLLAAELAEPGPGNALAVPEAAQRLDVPVSGCVVFARTKAALGVLNAAFAANAVKKQYWAIVEPPRAGIQTPDSMLFSESAAQSEAVELVHWLQFDPRRNKSIAHDEPGPGRKKAILRYRCAGRGQRYLFLEIELITGRHHQIRAQLQRLGLHIKGDLKYGSRRSERDGGIRLHACSISFPNPADNRHNDVPYITVQASPPQPDNLWQAFEQALTSAASGA